MGVSLPKLSITEWEKEFLTLNQETWLITNIDKF